MQKTFKGKLKQKAITTSELLQFIIVSFHTFFARFVAPHTLTPYLY